MGSLSCRQDMVILLNMAILRLQDCRLLVVMDRLMLWHQLLREDIFKKEFG